MSLARKVFSFSFFTMISRIFGYLRDICLAGALGTSLLNDAFIIAFRLPNLFRAIFAEGALSNAFVPIYSAENNIKKRDLFAANIRNILFLALLLLTVFIEIFMPYVVSAIAPGFIDDADALHNAILFSRITFIYIMMISLTAFYGSIMNAHDKFIPFASAPIILNLCIIVFLWQGALFVNYGRAAAFGVCMAGFAQLAWVLFFMKLYKIKLPLGNFKMLDKSKLMLKRMAPIAISSGFIQINFIVDNIFASLQSGAISYLYFANRLNLLPLSLVGISLSVVTLPTLAKYFKKNIQRALSIQNRAFIFAIYFAIPAAFALFFLSYEIIALLLGRGAFDDNSATQTSFALTAYAVGLPAWVMQKIMLANYHSRGDTSYPLKISIITICLNVILNAILFYLLGFIGVALASSIAVYANVGLLFKKALKLGFVKPNLEVLKVFIKSIVCSVVMIFGVKFLLSHWSFSVDPIKVLASFAAGFVIYVALTISIGVRLR